MMPSAAMACWEALPGAVDLKQEIWGNPGDTMGKKSGNTMKLLIHVTVITKYWGNRFCSDEKWRCPAFFPF
jgi:hypothetical protein